MNKPSKVEAGQRWKTEHFPEVLLGPRKGHPDNPWAEFPVVDHPGHFYTPKYLLREAEFLGYAQPDKVELGMQFQHETLGLCTVNGGQQGAWNLYREDWRLHSNFTWDESELLQGGFTFVGYKPGSIKAAQPALEQPTEERLEDAVMAFNKQVAAFLDSVALKPATSEQLDACIAAGVPSLGPTRVLRRSVSSDGKHWVDYERLYDPDPFESYRWREVVSVSAQLVETVERHAPSGKPAPGRAETQGDLAGSAAAALVTR